MKNTTGYIHMIVKSFKKQFSSHIVEMIDITSNKRIVVLQGENGSGKSTLLKAIHKLISYDGSIQFNGSISYMNENIKFPLNATVMDIINSLNIIDGRSKDEIVRLIDQYDLTSKINDQVSCLSKGMKMKLQLICTFLTDREVYLLDEPFSGLDKASVKKLIDYISKSSKKFIIASHLKVDFPKDFEVIYV